MKTSQEFLGEWLAEEGNDLWNEHLAALIEEHRQDWYDEWLEGPGTEAFNAWVEPREAKQREEEKEDEEELA